MQFRRELRTFMAVSIFVLPMTALSFEEIGRPAGKMDYDHVWQVPPVGHRYYSRNNRTEKDGFIEYIEVTESTRTVRSGNTSCTSTLPLYPFAPIVARENCGDGPLSSLTQEFWIEGSVFPLKKGIKWRFYTKNLTDKNGEVNPKQQTHRCSVKKEVRVRTIAGEFDTFKVACNAGFELRTYYYSPEVGDVVASRTTTPNRGETRNWEWLGPRAE